MCGTERTVSHMSPHDPQLIQLTGRFAVCTECKVPWTEPIPPRFPVTFRGPVQAVVATIHQPNCLYLRKVREGAPA